jgi:hypothetical protein
MGGRKQYTRYRCWPRLMIDRVLICFEQETIHLLKGEFDRTRKGIVGGWQTFPEPK